MIAYILGAIGSGKSTTAKLLAEETKSVLYEEKFEDNEHLEDFYEALRLGKDTKKVLEGVQISFMHEYQHLGREIERHYTSKNMVIDAGPLAGMAFVETHHHLNQIHPAFYKVYKMFWEYYFLEQDRLKKESSKFILIKRDPSDLLSKIDKRGREMEKGITPEYLDLLQYNYEKLLREHFADSWSGIIASPEENETSVLRVVRACIR
jgi:deoxyguanosine kinase